MSRKETSAVGVDAHPILAAATSTGRRHAGAGVEKHQKAPCERPDSLRSPLGKPLVGRVLLVEDNPDHQPLLSLFLKKAGFKVTVAGGGRQAVELARDALGRNQPFDIVLMDLQMPDMDGLTATRELRAAGFSSPIIALTARATGIDREECLKAGCNELLGKPIEREDLIATLADHLARHDEESPARAS